MIDDKALKDIFKNLYYPDSPYEFSVLPADILGQVYEKFLGKVICLTPSHQAKIEEKPEVRKAGGVYYAPTYIVDYIVKNTVGRLVENRKPGLRGREPKERAPCNLAFGFLREIIFAAGSKTRCFCNCARFRRLLKSGEGFLPSTRTPLKQFAPFIREKDFTQLRCNGAGSVPERIFDSKNQTSRSGFGREYLSCRT